MSELRQNLATKDWVIIANERARRPHDFSERGRVRSEDLPERDPNCPFCPGNEASTEADLIRWPADGPWRVRLFSNRYPALSVDAEYERCLTGAKRRISGVGYHEVLVESPLHNACPALQSPAAIHLTLRAMQTRGRQLIRDPHIEHVVYYKNHGPAAGSTLAHPHSQLLGMPMIPLDTRLRIEEARRSIDETGACPHCTMIKLEQDERERVVAENRFFIAFVPFAANSPFHMWILPKLHRPSFLAIGDDELAGLGAIMREVFGKLYHGLGDPDYNYMIRTAPFRDLESKYIHWYVSIVPRVTKSAGFELGSGMHINPSLPEESAAFLREIDPRLPAAFDPPEPAREIPGPEALASEP